MTRAEALRIAETALHQAGFQVSRRCTARTSCFDFAARNEERLLFIKAFPKIRDISREDAVGIKTIARCFSCASIFISDMYNEDALSDDTVYSRYDVYVVTSRTFKDMILGGIFPLVEAAPGCYCVRIDGSKIRERRQELGLSIGKLAGMAGISRRALYGYEKGMTRASVSAAYKLEEVLGVPLVKTVDPFEVPQSNPNVDSFSLSDLENIRNRLLRFVLRKLVLFEFRVSPTRRAPFDFAADCPRTRLKIIGAIVEKQERYAEERVEEILSLSRIVEAKPLLVGGERIAATGDTAFLNYDELERMRNREELTGLL